MPMINGEPEPTRRVSPKNESQQQKEQAELDYNNRHFDWRMRNSWPIPPPLSGPQPLIRNPGTPPKPEGSYGTIGYGDWDFGLSRWVLKQLLRLIDWLNGSLTSEDVVLLVQAEKGLQVKHYFQYLFFVRPIDGYDEDNEPIFGELIVVSHYDSDGNYFSPDGPFEVRKKKGKIRMIPYEWQPIAEKQKNKSKDGDGQRLSLSELFEGYEDDLPGQLGNRPGGGRDRC